MQYLETSALPQSWFLDKVLKVLGSCEVAWHEFVVMIRLFLKLRSMHEYRLCISGFPHLYKHQGITESPEHVYFALSEVLRKVPNMHLTLTEVLRKVPNKSCTLSSTDWGITNSREHFTLADSNQGSHDWESVVVSTQPQKTKAPRNSTMDKR